MLHPANTSEMSKSLWSLLITSSPNCFLIVVKAAALRFLISISSAVRAPLCPLIPNVEKLVLPSTTATDTVRPLTPSLLGPSRVTSPRGIINQPEVRRLDWPPVTFAPWRDFPQPYVRGAPCPAHSAAREQQHWSHPSIHLSCSHPHPRVQASQRLSSTNLWGGVWDAMVSHRSRYFPPRPGRKFHPKKLSWLLWRAGFWPAEAEC